jgi:hypothetical protein
VRLDGDFAVCAEDVDGASDLLVYILDELLDGSTEDGAFLGRKRVEVGCRKSRDLGGSFRLLALTVEC